MAEIIDFQEKKRQFEQSKRQESNLETKEDKVSNEFLKCQSCGSPVFTQAFILRVVTPFEDPELTENQVSPFPVFQCSKCKKVITVF